MLLLTLLPMAIWAAEPLSKAKMSVRNVPYGTQALVAGNAEVIDEDEEEDPDAPANPESDFRTSWDRDLVLGTDFTWNGKYYSDQACTTEVTDLATAPVGYYYVKFVGINFFEGEVVCPFQILKAPLYVSVVGGITATGNTYVGGNLFTTFGIPVDVTDLEIEDVKGLVNDEELDDVVSGEITAITSEETNANCKPGSDEGDVEVLNGASAYAVTITGLEADNYEIICVDDLWIMQKDITDGEGLTFALPVKSATYNGEIQEAAYEITYAGATLVQGEDFTVSYGPENKLTTFGEGDDQVTGPVNVYDYATVITGTGNFTGSYPNETLEEEDYDAETFVWSINQVGLTIITLDQTKMYDGLDGLPSYAEGKAYEVLLPYGLEDERDNVGLQFISLTPTDKKEVGKYTISSTIDPNKRNDNYDYNFVNEGELTITPRPVTITAKDDRRKITESDTKGYKGVTYEFYYAEDEGTVNEETGEFIPNSALKQRLENDTKSTTNGGFERPHDSGNNRGAGLYVDRKNKDTETEVGEYNTLEVKFGNANQGTIKNYTVTTVKGTYTITGGKIYITALSQSKNYGDPEPNWAPNRGVNYRVDIENQPGKGKDLVLVTEPTLTRAEGEAVGEYTITPSGAVAPAGYDAIVYANGKFTINKRPITITLANQTMTDGDKVSTLDQNAYTLEGTLAPNDNASDLFKLELVPFEVASAGSPYVPAVPAVDPQDAVWSFESFSSDGSDPEEDQIYGVGEVEVGETIEYDDEDYTEVTVTKNDPRGATTWNQAKTFEGNKYYVAVDPDEVDLDEGESLPERYELYTYDEVMVEEENPAYAEAVAANPDTDVPQWIMVGTGNYEMNGTDIWVEITLAKAAVEGQPAIPEQPEVEPGEESGVYTEGEGKKEKVVLRLDDGNFAEYTPGIQLTVLDAEKWANYEVTDGNDPEAVVAKPTATLWVISKDALVLDTRDAELAQKIEAADGEEKFIAFKNRTLKAGQWNVLVLPFETSVKELSAAFDYVAVDMLNEGNTNTSTVALTLSFGEIPANTPILVQPAEDVVLGDGFFFEKEVVYSENPEVADQAGHHFVGTYTGHYVTAEDKSEYYYSISAKAFVNSTSSTRIGSTGAYLKDDNAGTPNEVRYISIQDPDGEENVTAIGEIAADAASKADANAEGWYNVQGMKLNAAPTQRGIYIKDGKKVLVK